MNQQFYKNLALWVVILVVMLLLFSTLRQNEPAPPEIGVSEFMQLVETNQVESVSIEEGNIVGKQVDGGKFTTYAPPASIDNEFLAGCRIVGFSFSNGSGLLGRPRTASIVLQR